MRAWRTAVYRVWHGAGCAIRIWTLRGAAPRRCVKYLLDYVHASCCCIRACVVLRLRRSAARVFSPGRRRSPQVETIVWSAVMRYMYLVIPTAPIALITVARYERQSWTQTIPANFWSGLIESWTVAHLSQHPYGELRGTSLSTPSLLWSLW
jgi:hypothetical protein